MNSVKTNTDATENPLEAMKKVLDGYPAGEEFDELIAPVENHLRNEIRKRDCCFLLKASALVLVTFSILTLCTPIYAHLRALARLGLIQLSPYWDWSDYYDRDCLVENTFASMDDSLHQPDCSACEDIGTIETVTNISSRLLIDHYINQDVPVVVGDGAMEWPIVNDPDYNLDDIAQAYYLDNSGRKICHWKSNILPYSIELDDFFRQVDGYPYDRPWFAHWENCGRKSVKTGRRFYPRPYFITAAVDLSFNNWVLISNRYRARSFKHVGLHSRLAMVAQIRGSNHIRLVPQPACKSDCPAIQFTLLEGEIALLNSKRWNLEYQPGEATTNIAFIIQGEID